MCVSARLRRQRPPKQLYVKTFSPLLSETLRLIFHKLLILALEYAVKRHVFVNTCSYCYSSWLVVHSQLSPLVHCNFERKKEADLSLAISQVQVTLASDPGSKAHSKPVSYRYPVQTCRPLAKGQSWLL